MPLTRYLAVTDLETTGLDPERHEIIQISRTIVDLVNYRVLPDTQLNIYVRPTNWESRTKEAMEVNQISRELLDGEGVELRTALREFCRGVDWEQTVVAAWGNDFEMKFLKAAFEKSGRIPPYSYKSFDVRSAAYVPMIKAHSMTYRGLAAAAEWYGIRVDGSRVHDAEYDVHLTCEVLFQALKK